MEKLWVQILQIANMPLAGLTGMQDLTAESVVLRLALAVLLGGVIGLERGRKNRPAGFRTYMLVCLGAALTMMLGQYNGLVAQQAGLQSDVTRFGAQVINGIGFLGAGTILVTQKQQVKGLTTAAGLWASACMGLALGAGFYACVGMSFLLIMAVVWLLPKIEVFLVEKSRNMDVYVEVETLDGIPEVIGCLKAEGIHIYDVDIDRGSKSGQVYPNAVFSVRLIKGLPHTRVVAMLSQLEQIRSIKEI